MAIFITRVELHDAKSDHYEKLHEEMQKEGFERTIASDVGIKYYLPTAEYYKECNDKRFDVILSAKKAAEKTKKECSVVAIEVTGVTWDGLKKV